MSLQFATYFIPSIRPSLAPAADHMLPRKQYPSRAGIQTILDELTARNPKAKQAKPEDFTDIRFIQHLDESGYIDQLYTHK